MKFEYLTYEEIASLKFEKCWLVLPVGPYEQHGPHLPVSTDIVIARYLAESVCETLKMEKDEYFGVEGPAFAYAPAGISDGIGRTPQFTPRSFAVMLSEALSRYIETGFKNIIILVHHFELKFLKCLIEAINDCESKNPGIKIVEPLSAYYYSGEYSKAVADFIKSKKNSEEKQDEIYKNYLDIDFKSEIHADIKETSLMMYLQPRSVKSEVALRLDPFIVNPAIEFLKLNFTFKNMGAANGYIGSPSRASIFLGELLFKQMRNYILNYLHSVSAGLAPQHSIPLYIKAVLTVI